MKSTSEEVIAVSGALGVMSAALFAILGGVLAFAGLDEVIRIHGLLIAVAAIGAGLYIMANPRKGGLEEQQSYMDGPIKFATLAAVFWGCLLYTSRCV